MLFRSRVVSVGDWAHELCGGTHVKNSGELGLVKLISESSIGAGVRRVEALVGTDAYNFLAREHIILDSLTELIKGAQIEELPERISDLLEKLKSAEKQINEFKTARALEQAKDLVDKRKSFAGFDAIVSEFTSGINADDLRTIALDLRKKIGDGVVALISKGEDKVSIVTAVGSKGRDSGIKANEIVQAAALVLGGKGGGKEDFAQGSGKNIQKIKETISTIENLLNA